MDRNDPVDDSLNTAAKVATREGGVDRNWKNLAALIKVKTSPPARVAWIETRS